jgi:hypothetical protein
MDRSRIAGIADKWMIPTSKTAYMAGLEKKPVIAVAASYIIGLRRDLAAGTRADRAVYVAGTFFGSRWSLPAFER